MNENLHADRPTFVSHLECSMTGERYPADTLHGLSRVGRPLLVRYDLAAVAAALPGSSAAPPSTPRHAGGAPDRPVALARTAARAADEQHRLAR